MSLEDAIGSKTFRLCTGHGRQLALRGWSSQVVNERSPWGQRVRVVTHHLVGRTGELVASRPASPGHPGHPPSHPAHAIGAAKHNDTSALPGAKRSKMARAVFFLFTASLVLILCTLQSAVANIDLSSIKKSELEAIVEAAGATCDGCTKKQLVAKATELMSSGTLKSSKPSEGTCPAGDDSCKAEGGGQRQPGAPPKPGFADFTFASYILALNAQSLLETGEWRRAVGVSDKVDPKTEKPQRPPRATIDKYYSEVGALYADELERLGHPPPANQSDIPKEGTGECEDPVTFSAYLCAQHKVASRFLKKQKQRDTVRQRIGTRIYQAITQYLDEDKREVDGDDIKQLSKHVKSIVAQFAKLGIYSKASVQWEPKAKKVYLDTGSATFLLTTQQPIYEACNEVVNSDKSLKGFTTDLIGGAIDAAFTASLMEVERRPPAPDSVEQAPADVRLEEWTVSSM